MDQPAPAPSITIPFARPPAYVTLVEGLSLAARAWAATWPRWVLAVVAVGITNALATGLLGGAALDARTTAALMVPGAGGLTIDPGQLPRLLAGPIAVTLVSLVAGWFLLANAVALLRGREVTLAWALGGGLRSLAASMLLAIALFLPMTVALALRGLGVLLLLVLLPALVYLVFRLSFWGTAIFDGAGVTGGLSRTWDLSRRAVLRILGWSLVAGLIGLGVSILGSLVAAALPGAAGDGIVGVLDTLFQAYGVILTAILYESQRGRTVGFVPPAYPVAAPPPSDEDGPLAPPPPPPTGPWG